MINRLHFRRDDAISFLIGMWMPPGGVSLEGKASKGMLKRDAPIKKWADALEE